MILAHGHIGIDTAQNYGNGTSEKVDTLSRAVILCKLTIYIWQMLGTLDLKGLARIDTKIFPLHPGDHAASRIKDSIKKSLQDLGPHKIRVFYLHAPDRATPYEETLEAVNDLYKQGILYAVVHH